LIGFFGKQPQKETVMRIWVLIFGVFLTFLPATSIVALVGCGEKKIVGEPPHPWGGCVDGTKEVTNYVCDNGTDSAIINTSFSLNRYMSFVAMKSKWIEANPQKRIVSIVQMDKDYYLLHYENRSSLQEILGANK